MCTSVSELGGLSSDSTIPRLLQNIHVPQAFKPSAIVPFVPLRCTLILSDFEFLLLTFSLCFFKASSPSFFFLCLPPLSWTTATITLDNKRSRSIADPIGTQARLHPSPPFTRPLRDGRSRRRRSSQGRPPHKTQKSKREIRRFTRYVTIFQWWRDEWFYTFTCLLSAACLAVLLAKYDGKVVPELLGGLQLDTLSLP